LPCLRRLFSRTDRLIGWVGEFASLLWTVLMLVIVVQVVARYAFGQGSIMMEELQWHLYAIGFMLGLSFTEVKRAQCAHRRAGREAFARARGCGSNCSAWRRCCCPSRWW
jgi:TRAP-type mannitol/chloroaromatic compound transport system permease small subunit